MDSIFIVGSKLRKSILVVLGFTYFLLLGCSEDTNNQPVLKDNCLSNNIKLEDLSAPVVLDEDINFIVYSDGDISYYIVVNNDGQIMEEAGFDCFPVPNLSVIDTDLIKLSKGMGSATTYSKFFNTKENLISDWYLNVIFETNDYIIYLDEKIQENRKLIIQNPFDKQQMYQEYGDFEFSDSINPILNVKLVSDNSIQITYLSGENYDIKTSHVNIAN